MHGAILSVRFGACKSESFNLVKKRLFIFLPLGSSSGGFFCLPFVFRRLFGGLLERRFFHCLPAGCSSAVCGSLFLPVLAVFSGCFERFFASSRSRYDFLFEKSLTRLPGIDISVCVMHIFNSLGAVGLGAASRILKSKIKETAAAVVVAFVGIGPLLAPVSVLSNGFDGDEPDDPPPPAPPPLPDNAPYVSCLWIENHGSIGFTVEFDVGTPSGGTISFERFHLTGEGSNDVDAPYESAYCDWLSIPGFDGGPPLPYPGYNQYNPAFSFNIAGQKEYWEDLGSLDFPEIFYYWATEAHVDISLYVILNSEGALYSMMAWAYDSDGDGYEVPIYYSAGGGSFSTLP